MYEALAVIVFLLIALFTLTPALERYGFKAQKPTDEDTDDLMAIVNALK